MVILIKNISSFFKTSLGWVIESEMTMSQTTLPAFLFNYCGKLELLYKVGKLEYNPGIMSKKKKVLCVDDDADDQMIVLDTIKEIDESIEVQTALNGMQALQFLEAAKDTNDLPCLIIMDINMPLMDGKQTLVQIKKDGGLDGVPVVMFTTSSSQLDVAFCEQYGVNFITKPINMRDFHTIVQRLLSYCIDE